MAVGDVIFTQKELEEAAERAANPVTPVFLQLILDDVLKHREPEYLDGRAYEDDDGWYWLFCTSEGSYPGVWLAFGADGFTPYSTPRRPLHLMTSGRARE